MISAFKKMNIYVKRISFFRVNLLCSFFLITLFKKYSLIIDAGEIATVFEVIEEKYIRVISSGTHQSEVVR